MQCPGEICCLPWVQLSSKAWDCTTHKNEFFGFPLSKCNLPFAEVNLSLPFASKSQEKPNVYALAVLAFPCSDFSLSGSLSPYLPSFLKFPNKSQQIDTYLPPPPSLSCPFSCSCLMWCELINQTTACPLLFPFFSLYC